MISDLCTENRWIEKWLHGEFQRDIEDKINKEGRCLWMTQNDLKAELYALILATQKQAPRRKYRMAYYHSMYYKSLMGTDQQYSGKYTISKRC